MKRKNFLPYIVASVLLSFFASITAHRLISEKARQAANRIPKTAVVIVAANDISEFGVIAEKDLAVQQWHRVNLPRGYFSKLKDLVGKIAKQNIIKGQAILRAGIQEKNFDAGLAEMINKGKRAMTVPVNEVIGVAGFVKPDDRVDVYATADRGIYKENPLTRIILTNVRVLAAGEKIKEKIDNKKSNLKKPKKKTKPIKVKVVTLEVSPKDAQRLAIISAKCKIHLALINIMEKEKSKTKLKSIHMTDIFPTKAAMNKGYKRYRKKSKQKKSQDLCQMNVEVIKGSKRMNLNFAE